MWVFILKKQSDFHEGVGKDAKKEEVYFWQNLFSDMILSNDFYKESSNLQLHTFKLNDLPDNLSFKFLSSTIYFTPILVGHDAEKAKAKYPTQTHHNVVQPSKE